MKALTFIIATLVLFALLAGGVFWYFNRLLSAPEAGEAVDTITLEISAGSDTKAIGEQLQAAGLIRSVTAFRLFLWLEGLASKLQAGTYTLNTGQGVETIARSLSRGDVETNEVKFQVLEGWTLRQIATEYGETFSPTLKRPAEDLAQEFLTAAQAVDSREILPGNTYVFLTDKPATAGLEGFLYPDTYRVYEDSTPPQVIEKMLNNFGRKMDQSVRDLVPASGLTLYEVVTLASIIEKEVRTDADRKMVADLFLRRMANSIPLQSDATVNYVTGKDLLQPSINDTRTESPYNTYLYQGLPPGPIANPSISSIMAVLQPTPNEFFYYLSAPDGQTIFGRTFEEHKLNKAKYLQ